RESSFRTPKANAELECVPSSRSTSRRATENRSFLSGLVTGNRGFTTVPTMAFHPRRVQAFHDLPEADVRQQVVVASHAKVARLRDAEYTDGPRFPGPGS